MAANTKPAPASGRDAASAPSKNETLEWVKSIGIAVVLFLLIRTFLFAAYTIPSNSMERTLLVGDYLMANNTVFGARLPFTDIALPGLRDPRHGEIVVFRPTYNDPIMDVVKRVIGVPGDTLESRDGVLFRNGQRLDEPYARFRGEPDAPLSYTQPDVLSWQLPALAPGVNPATYVPTRQTWGPIVVPGGHYFLMGDNRDDSLDSRFMGFIPREVIRGKPLFIYYSFDRETGAALPALTQVRWSRIGDVIR